MPIEKIEIRISDKEMVEIKYPFGFQQVNYRLKIEKLEKVVGVDHKLPVHRFYDRHNKCTVIIQKRLSDLSTEEDRRTLQIEGYL